MRDVREFLVYDDSSPSYLMWRTHWANNYRGRLSGKPFGAVNGDGYYEGMFDGKLMKAHRIVYYIHHGTMPTAIDHIDGNRANNRADNLRPTNHALNGQNRRNDVGYYYSRGRFVVSLQTFGERIRIGSFDSALDARAAYLRAKRNIHMQHVV